MSSIKDNRPSRTTAPLFRRNGELVDPQYILNGDSINGAGGGGFQNSQFALMFSLSDTAYVGTSPLLPGANLGKNAAGQIMRFWPSQADNTSIVGSDASTDSIGLAGWWMNTYGNGIFLQSNWLVSVILVNPSTANYGVIVGARFFQGAIGNIEGLLQLAQSLQGLQYAADSFQTGGVAQSVAFQFSVSISGQGGGGAFLMSQNLGLLEEFMVKITSASNKSGSKVEVRTNG